MSVQDIYDGIMDSIPQHQLEKASNIITIRCEIDGQAIVGENDAMEFAKKYHEGVVSFYSDTKLVETEVSKVVIRAMGILPKVYIN